MRYAVVIEQSGATFSAFVPDLPGCVAVGESEAEIRRLIAEAIIFHIESLRESGDEIPRAVTQVDYFETEEAA